MSSNTIQRIAQAMAFHHQDGLPAAWKQTQKFVGKDGRMATMPDIIASRIETKPGDVPWEMYFTTTTAEYFGYTRQGVPILIVAHGVGPMSNIDGICKTYSWQYKDQSRKRRGGRITEKEFWDLEAGKFGEVNIVDITSYFKRYKYPLIQTLRTSEALMDPLVKARFGSETEKYLLAHAAHARAWHRERAGITPEKKSGAKDRDHRRFVSRQQNQHAKDGAEGSDPFIIKVGGAANCFYGDPQIGFQRDEGYAFGHLISAGSLCNVQREDNESLVGDTDCHEWSNGVRMVGIPANVDIRSGLHPGPNPYTLLRKHWKDLLVPLEHTGNPITIGFCGLVEVSNQWFTQYPKEGERMDTGEPEYVVTTLEKIGEPIQFRTTVGGYHGFFKFGLKEVQAIAPPNANAYHFVTEPVNEWNGGNPTHQTCMVQFYHAKVDTSKRLIRRDKLAHDYDALMQLVIKDMQTA